MGKLTFVGLGLGAKGIPMSGVDAMKMADIVYLEYYTTPHEATLLDELEKVSGKQVTIVDRGFVEDGSKVLTEALAASVVLAVPGDPMIATTHNDLRTRAIEAGIDTAVIHAASIASSAASASGLHYYKFGGTVTVTRGDVSSLQQVYHTLHRNLLFGMHTLLLLEVDFDTGQGVTPNAALEGLLRAETNFKRDVVSADSFAIVLSRLGRTDSQLKAGSISDLSRLDYGEYPHCLIIPGPMHFTESEAISAVFTVPKGKIRDNAEKLKRTAQILVPKYVAKTRRALESVKGKVGPGHESLLENVELYMLDAERFLANGEDELAMLNIGYAEGLLDALGFTGKVKVDWET